MKRNWIGRLAVLATVVFAFVLLPGCEHHNHNHGVRDHIVHHRH